MARIKPILKKNLHMFYTQFMKNIFSSDIFPWILFHDFSPSFVCYFDMNKEIYHHHHWASPSGWVCCYVVLHLHFDSDFIYLCLFFVIFLVLSKEKLTCPWLVLGGQILRMGRPTLFWACLLVTVLEGVTFCRGGT